MMGRGSTLRAVFCDAKKQRVYDVTVLGLQSALMMSTCKVLGRLVYL